MFTALPAAAYTPDVAYEAAPAASVDMYEGGDGFTSVTICEGTGWGRTREATKPAGWLAEVRNVLGQTASLGENWDYAGGAAPEPKAVSRAAVLLERLAAEPGVPRPTVGPTRGGAVQMEWEDADRDRYFEIEVPGDGNLLLLFQDGVAREEREWAVPLKDCLSALLPDISRVTN